MIRIENLYKSFNNIPVLKNINLHVNKGEIVSIIGESGAGKSTLMRCINLLEIPDKGNIYIDGINIIDNKTRISEFRKNIGMVFQTFNLFEHLSVIDNLTYAPIKLLKENKQQAEIKARQLLKQVGLLNRENSLPNELSGGQKQRVAIARCLAMNPKIILFDEPTSALDPIRTNEVLAVIRKLAKSKITMVIVTHEMNFAKEISNRIIYMNDGKICEEGTPEKIFNNPAKKETKKFIYKECNFTYEINSKDYDIYSLNSEILEFFEKYAIPNEMLEDISLKIQEVLNLIFKLNNNAELTLSYLKEKMQIKLEIVSEGNGFSLKIPKDFNYKRKDKVNILEAYLKIKDRRKSNEKL